ncbi:MAG TPA: ParB/RepB/Spo0J family partition protein [Thermoanaerobaculia bacterium]|nr:ParB/RepB/Spo0J family partition protein [Thermoanaerobaculia bacterium]
MTSKKALGRGLGALIPPGDKKVTVSPRTHELPISQIIPNPRQPRVTFRDEAMEELATSIREHGILQPLLVSRMGADRYRLIAGERRFRAAQKAGLKAVPVMIKEVLTDQNALEIALIENIQREDLNPIEEALAYQQLHKQFGLTQEEIAKRVGKERSSVANILRLLKLPDDLRGLVAESQLSMGHARALLSVEDRKRQSLLAKRIIDEGLSVRQTEQLTAEPIAAKPVKKDSKPKDVFTADAEEKLQRALRTKVEIMRMKKGGTIQIRFGSEDELIRLFEDLVHGRNR